MRQGILFRDLLSCFLIITILVGGCVFPASSFAEQDGPRKPSKWLVWGAAAVGAAVGLATLGVAGIIVGPAVGIVMAAGIGMFGGVHPEDTFRAALNKPSVHFVQQTKEVSNIEPSRAAPEVTLAEAEARYKKAYKAYTEAMQKNVQGSELNTVLKEYRAAQSEFFALKK